MHFELWVSQNLQLAEAGVMDRSEAPVTLAFIPRAMPEELFAKCGAGGPAGCFMACCTATTRLPAFWTNGPRTKPRQGDLNVLMDKGWPSKVDKAKERTCTRFTTSCKAAASHRRCSCCKSRASTPEMQTKFCIMRWCAGGFLGDAGAISFLHSSSGKLVCSYLPVMSLCRRPS